MADSVFKNILEAIQTVIQGLDLKDIADENIQIVKTMSKRETVEPGLPGILIFPLGPETMNPRGGTNASEDIGYPVGIVMLAGNRVDGTQDQDVEFDRFLFWRERIRSNFINQRLSGVVSTFRVNVEPQQVFDPARFKHNIDRGVLVLRVMSRELRGTV